MRLPLFVHASPTTPSSPTVNVLAGEWFVELNNKDSALNLSVISGDNENILEGITNGLKLVIPEPSLVQAIIVKPGSEPHLSLYLNDSKSHSAEE